MEIPGTAQSVTEAVVAIIANRQARKVTRDRILGFFVDAVAHLEHLEACRQDRQLPIPDAPSEPSDVLPGLKAAHEMQQAARLLRDLTELLRNQGPGGKPGTVGDVGRGGLEAWHRLCGAEDKIRKHAMECAGWRTAWALTKRDVTKALGKRRFAALTSSGMRRNLLP